MNLRKFIIFVLVICTIVTGTLMLLDSPFMKYAIAKFEKKVNEQCLYNTNSIVDNNEEEIENSSTTETSQNLSPFPTEVEIPETPKPKDKKEPVIKSTNISGGLKISNSTSFDIEINELLKEGPSQKLPSEGIQILIIHTHASEAYTQDMVNKYEESDSYRTQDKNQNIIRIGDELAAAFESHGLKVIHDRGVYDYPSYAGCYSRSGHAVEEHLAEHPEIAVVLDVHRDAIGDDDVIYKTVAEDSGKPCSQVMLLVGTGEKGLSHPLWKENLKLAMYLQNAVDSKYKTLTRPIALKMERYNQQLCTGSLLIEVGSNGNTLDEAINSVRLFADAAAPALLELVSGN